MTTTIPEGVTTTIPEGVLSEAILARTWVAAAHAPAEDESCRQRRLLSERLCSTQMAPGSNSRGPDPALAARLLAAAAASGLEAGGAFG